MAVEFYDINDKSFKNYLFQLYDEDFEKLKDVLIEYKRRTGLSIDQYGNTRINIDHVKLIIKLIEDYNNNFKVDKRLSEIKKSFESATNDLFAVGD